MKYYLENVKDVLKELDSNENGLTSVEARSSGAELVIQGAPPSFLFPSL